MIISNRIVTLGKSMLTGLFRTLVLTLTVIGFQAEDGIRDQPRSRGLGDVYKRQIYGPAERTYCQTSVKR